MDRRTPPHRHSVGRASSRTGGLSRRTPVGDPGRKAPGCARDYSATRHPASLGNTPIGRRGGHSDALLAFRIPCSRIRTLGPDGPRDGNANRRLSRNGRRGVATRSAPRRATGSHDASCRPTPRGGHTCCDRRRCGDHRRIGGRGNRRVLRVWTACGRGRCPCECPLLTRPRAGVATAAVVMPEIVSP